MYLFPITQQQIKKVNEIDLSNFDNPEFARSSLLYLLTLGYTPWTSNNIWKCYSNEHIIITDIQDIDEISYIDCFLEGTNKCVFAFYTNGDFETKTTRTRSRDGYFLDENKLIHPSWKKTHTSGRYRTNDIREITQIRNIITII